MTEHDQNQLAIVFEEDKESLIEDLNFAIALIEQQLTQTPAIIDSHQAQHMFEISNSISMFASKYRRSFSNEVFDMQKVYKLVEQENLERKTLSVGK